MLARYNTYRQRNRVASAICSQLRKNSMDCYSNAAVTGNADEEWAHVHDQKERRRIQNRIAQRRYRKKAKAKKEALSCAQPVVPARPFSPPSTRDSESAGVEWAQIWHRDTRHCYTCKIGTIPEGWEPPSAGPVAPQHSLVHASWSLSSLYQQPPNPANGAYQCFPASLSAQAAQFKGMLRLREGGMSLWRPMPQQSYIEEGRALPGIG
ncbi:hypothetical protein DM02DRAFT_678726 [Periconia macrospinosa]|uniref:BZIP domain-containing protein n=1 Tax=Periconia macrospinosa TaxID=97972 RepID=A0A2V1CXN2_9PLEO|nr:hypothetical protein DM02DRAFT_678726 [Periconia macrospinosa]